MGVHLCSTACVWACVWKSYLCKCQIRLVCKPMDQLAPWLSVTKHWCVDAQRNFSVVSLTSALHAQFNKYSRPCLLTICPILSHSILSYRPWAPSQLMVESYISQRTDIKILEKKACCHNDWWNLALTLTCCDIIISCVQIRKKSRKYNMYTAVTESRSHAPKQRMQIKHTTWYGQGLSASCTSQAVKPFQVKVTFVCASKVATEQNKTTMLVTPTAPCIANMKYKGCYLQFYTSWARL